MAVAAAAAAAVMVVAAVEAILMGKQHRARFFCHASFGHSF